VEGYIVKKKVFVLIDSRSIYYFIWLKVGLPLTARRHDSIFVVVDTLTKSAHFIPVRTTYQAPDIARVFISENVRLHGVPKRIISDRGSVFTGRFWTSFQEVLGTQLNFSTTYHPETDRQTERMNQTLEDMLRMYVMDQQKRGEEFLPLVKFAYNNSYRAPLRWRLLSFFMGDRVGRP
jgi:transposase InsO family protein